jgi:hypothetical protein
VCGAADYGADDIGWGCAYRALQTCLSCLQHRTPAAFPDASMPSLLSIQATLADAGQIPQSDVGSHRWIEPYVKHATPERNTARCCVCMVVSLKAGKCDGITWMNACDSHHVMNEYRSEYVSLYECL